MTSHQTQDQSEVEAFLSAACALPGSPPERIDTHAATLFLGPTEVVKIKKAVRFPYLDFSSLKRREAALRRELERGLEIAPDIYSDVVPVTREAGGHLAINGLGPPVEWSLRMHRFDEADMLSRRADAGKFDIAAAEDLGHRVAAMHDAGLRKHGGAAAIGAVMRENFGSLAEFPDLFPSIRREKLAAGSEAALEQVAGVLDQRGRQGFVRLCHGDLHLGNIVMLDDVPTPFDAIEFDDEIATIDTFYDLAYLLMDIWVRGLRAPANRLLNRYLEATGDDAGLATLPLFLSMRAAIRAKVLAVAGHGKAAQGYCDWALKFLDIPSPSPCLVAVGGLSGTGKTTIARSIAPDLGPAPGAIVVRSDIIRKSKAGIAETRHLPRDTYTKDAGDAVYAALRDRANAVLKTGHATIIDAVNARKGERDAVEQLAKDNGAVFHGFWLEAEVGLLLARVEGRRGDASDANADIVELQQGYDIGPLAWIRIDASGSPDEVAARVQKITDSR